MTRLRKRTARRRTDELGEGFVRQLLHGLCYFPDDGFGDVDESPEADAAMRDAWNVHRDRLLADWLAARPSSRPFAWWRYDAPEPRQRIDGEPHPFADPRRQGAVLRAAAEYGPNCWLCHAAFSLSHGTPVIAGLGEGFGAKYESQAAYLDRLGLLTDDERRLLFRGSCREAPYK